MEPLDELLRTERRHAGEFEVLQGVEVVGAQVGALQTLMADPLLANLTFQPITVHTDKVTRALPLIARCEQGKLAIVRARWNKDYLDELSGFPESNHDDQVDSTAAALTMLGTYSGPTAVVVDPHEHNARAIGLSRLTGNRSRGFQWDSDHPYRPHGSNRYPLL